MMARRMRAGGNDRPPGDRPQAEIVADAADVRAAVGVIADAAGAAAEEWWRRRPRSWWTRRRGRRKALEAFATDLRGFTRIKRKATALERGLFFCDCPWQRTPSYLLMPFV